MRHYLTATLPSDIAGAGADDDITTWQAATSDEDIALASGVVTLKANRIYKLSLCMSVAANSNTTAGFAGYEIVKSDNTALVPRTRSVLWPTTHAGAGGGPRGYSGVTRIIYPVGSTDEDVHVRCTIANGTHRIESSNSHFEIVDRTAAVELAVDDSAHGHTAESPTLTQSNVLSMDSASQTHTADNVDLTQANALAVDSGLLAQLADTPALTQAHLLVVQDVTHDQQAGNIVLTTAGTLAVDGALHSQAADSVTLSEAALLDVANALHAHGADNVALTQAHILAVAEALHAQAVANIVLRQSHILAIDAAGHQQTADAVTLSLSDILSVADSVHVQTAGDITLTQAHVLVVSDALHQQLAERVDLDIPGGGLASNAVFVVETGERIYLVAQRTRIFHS